MLKYHSGCSAMFYESHNSQSTIYPITHRWVKTGIRLCRGKGKNIEGKYDCAEENLFQDRQCKGRYLGIDRKGETAIPQQYNTWRLLTPPRQALRQKRNCMALSIRKTGNHSCIYEPSRRLPSHSFHAVKNGTGIIDTRVKCSAFE